MGHRCVDAVRDSGGFCRRSSSNYFRIADDTGISSFSEVAPSGERFPGRMRISETGLGLQFERGGCVKLPKWRKRFRPLACRLAYTSGTAVGPPHFTCITRTTRRGTFSTSTCPFDIPTEAKPLGLEPPFSYPL